MAAAGWSLFAVSESDGDHVVALFRLPEGASDDDATTFVQALDTARGTPLGAVALGGPEIGAEGAVTTDLTPGTHVLACLTRTDSGHRHATMGEFRLLNVQSADLRPDEAPVAGDTLYLLDFAYRGADTIPSGTATLAVTNDGVQDHQVRVARLHEGETLQRWLSAKEPSQIADDVVGVARLGSKQTVFLPISLTSGRYVVYCLIPDRRSGRPHVRLGMFRSLTVL